MYIILKDEVFITSLKFSTDRWCFMLLHPLAAPDGQSKMIGTHDVCSRCMYMTDVLFLKEKENHYIFTMAEYCNTNDQNKL